MGGDDTALDITPTSSRWVLPLRSTCVERGLQPLHPIGLDHHHVKSAGRHVSQAHQVVVSGKHDTPLLDPSHTGRRAAVAFSAELTEDAARRVV